MKLESPSIVLIYCRSLEYIKLTNSYVGDWVEPWDASSFADIEACERKLEFAVSWFADPIYFGHYPASMVAQLGNRLPSWSPEDLALVEGSNDFYGLNHYTANFIRHRTGTPEPEDFLGNLECLFMNKEGKIIGPDTQSSWLKPHPVGFRKIMNWLSNRYGKPKIYVTENGTSLKGENSLSRDEILEDDFRVKYFQDYIAAMTNAIVEDGVDCRGYMAWSLMEYVLNRLFNMSLLTGLVFGSNFEWAEGYETRFGVTYIDYEGGHERYPKKSAREISKIFDSLISKE